MNTFNCTERAFYQHLAGVFYAVAAIDRTVRQEELDELKEIVRSEWLPINDTRDEYGTELVYYILITFEWLHKNNCDIEKLIFRFKLYRKEHESLFTAGINELILKTSYRIASAFAGRNKSELVLLSRLEVLLA